MGRMDPQPGILRFSDYMQIEEENKKYMSERFTRMTLSLAARTTISAQETTRGQAASSSDLMISITSSPFKSKLGVAAFSLSMPTAGSSRTEASHPCFQHQTQPQVR